MSSVTSELALLDEARKQLYYAEIICDTLPNL